MNGALRSERARTPSQGDGQPLARRRPRAPRAAVLPLVLAACASFASGPPPPPSGAAVPGPREAASTREPAVLEPLRLSPAAPVAVLPVEIQNGQIVARVEIPDAGTLKMFVDTGASGTVLDREAAGHLGLAFDDALRARVRGAAASIDVEVIRGPLLLRLGGAELEVPRAAAMPLGSLSRRLGWRLDGVLGADLFRRYVVEIDYAGGEITLHEPASFEPPRRASVVALDFHRGLPTLRATLTAPDGRRLTGRFHLDSGAAASLVLTRHFAEAHGLPAALPRTIEVPAHGASRATSHAVGRLRSLTLGGVTLPGPLAAFSRAAEGPLADPAVAGVVGGKALERFTVTLDLPRRRMYLEPNGDLREPDRLVGTGLTLSAQGETFDRYTVVAVIATGPAGRAGIRPGDRLLAVGDRPAGELSLKEIERRLRREGESVEVEIGRGDEALRLTLTPEDLL